jgi:hypothetical protein
MKPLGFLISILARLFFLLLLVKVQFPVPDAVLAPQVIRIVPMSPPRRPAGPPPLPDDFPSEELPACLLFYYN